MTNMNYIIGVDPGPMVGIVGLLVVTDRSHPSGAAGSIISADVIQCSDHVLLNVLGALHSRAILVSARPPRVVLAYEQFVIGLRAAGLNAPMASAQTRSAITLLREWGANRVDQVVERRAIDVKPWATDERLDAVGLKSAVKGMVHARDAARHALFTAVRSCGLPDPLSARSGAA